MLELNHVTKRFPPLVAVNDVSFNVPHGSVLGLLGPNGAGKTTLFKLMAGFLYPDAGQIQATHTWPMTGFKPERLLYPGHLQVGEYLELVAHLSNTEKARVRQVVAEALARVKLAGAARKRIRDCSKGMRQRLGLAQVLVGQPALLLVDEPFDGLDPEGQIDVRGIIHELHTGGCTVVLSSHQLHEVTQVCTHIVILNRGKVHYANRMAEALTVRPHVTIRTTQDLTQMRARLEALHPKIHADGVEVTLSEEAIELRRDVLRTLLEAGLDVCHVEQQRATLQEIYAEVVQS